MQSCLWVLLLSYLVGVLNMRRKCTITPGRAWTSCPPSESPRGVSGSILGCVRNADAHDSYVAAPSTDAGRQRIERIPASQKCSLLLSWVWACSAYPHEPVPFQARRSSRPCIDATGQDKPYHPTANATFFPEINVIPLAYTDSSSK